MMSLFLLIIIFQSYIFHEPFRWTYHDVYVFCTSSLTNDVSICYGLNYNILCGRFTYYIIQNDRNFVLQKMVGIKYSYFFHGLFAMSLKHEIFGSPRTILYSAMVMTYIHYYNIRMRVRVVICLYYKPNLCSLIIMKNRFIIKDKL